MKERAKDLAGAHWDYNRGLLEAHGLPDAAIDASAYVYITAFEHGYKHAIEDVRDPPQPALEMESRLSAELASKLFGGGDVDYITDKR